MEKLWTRHDRPVPASYWVAASVASLFAATCFLTAWWVPAFAVDWGASMFGFGVLAPVLMLLAGAVFGILMGSLVFLALRWPWAAIALALTPLLATVFDRAPVHFGVLATLCAIAITAGWRRPAASATALALAATITVCWLLLTGRAMAAPFRSHIDTAYWTLSRSVGTALLYLLGYAAVLGVAAVLRYAALTELERHELAGRADQVEEQAAVVAERSRLARDLHDVVAHHVSLIAVRAETAPYTHPGLDSEARTVLTDIAADARLALDELRGVLGILGRAGEDAQRAPQPTWQDITALVERARTAGAVVMLQGDSPETATVAPAVGYAAYRVVQEGLTNARKHAPGRPVTVALISTGQLVIVRVSTPMRGEPVSSGRAVGHGLAGMRERVEALGGRLQAGPEGDEFVVEAMLPQAAAA